MAVTDEITYYMRPVNGDDSADGMSFATAWKTWRHTFNTLTNAGGYTPGATFWGSRLLLANEGGSYTGPYHGPTGAEYDYRIDSLFTSIGNQFMIQGVSSDGNAYEDVNFVFDMSGFTYEYWLYCFSSVNVNSANGLSFKNITWRGLSADAGAKGILTTLYDNEAARMVSYDNCIFEDNEVVESLFGYGGYNGSYDFINCIFRRNNSYNNNKGCISSNYHNYNSQRNSGLQLYECEIHSNNKHADSSPYILATPGPLGNQNVKILNSVFYDNGNADSDIVLHFNAQTEAANIRIQDCVFFGNAGTGIYYRSANTDANYGDSIYGSKIISCVFALNNKSIDAEATPGVRQAMFTNNLFYNNTVVDIPTWMSGTTGWGISNTVGNPAFTNGQSGDFSAALTSPVFVNSRDVRFPIGGRYVVQTESTSTLPTIVSFF